MRTLYLFRRDLRIYDNRALLQAYKDSEKIFTIYIFNKNYFKYREIDLNHKFTIFILNILKEINKKIKIHVFFGDIKEILANIFSKYKIDAVYFSDSLSWFEEKENKEIEEICKEYKVKCRKFFDNFLTDPRKFKPTYNFSNFYKRWLKDINSNILPEIKNDKFSELDELDIHEFIKKFNLIDYNEEHIKFEWLEKRKREFIFENYNKFKDYPGIDGTSKLSHFINVGAISIRELYNIAKDKSNEFIRQLSWREYYYSIRFWYPWMKNLEIKKKMRNIKWENDMYFIKSFFEGKTGYPIVDAGIKQLKQEGWIHNRVRLILANFLVKDLLVDWRIGEKFFRKYLIDYDEVLNVGNWQWCASVGIDPLPLRLFNPIVQAKKYDPYCKYIKKYLGELKEIDCKALHNPIQYKIGNYIEPIVNHYEQIKKFRNLLY
ncbi:MAG: deoxyribodipyrimidine photo-lyase [Nanopusillaceae archaeon]